MKVEYIDHMGSDLTVANAARVSFKKHKKEFEEDDTKLIRYLAKHNHWTPFGHPTICLRITAPIFVARQLFKHKVGFVENEVSRRYVDEEPDFYWPDVWRGRPTNGAKQGSSGAVADPVRDTADSMYHDVLRTAERTYNEMIAMGIAPEQARMVLPQSMYTEWYWTGSLASLARVYQLRSDPHAQKETQEIAQQIHHIVQFLFPVSWEALIGDTT